MKKTIWLLGCVIACAGPLHADYKKGNSSLIFTFGPGGYSDDIKVNNGDTKLRDCGGLVGLQYLYYPSNSLSLGIGPDIAWTQFNEDDDPSNVIAGYRSNGEIRSAVSQLMAKLSVPTGHWRPYVIGGMGASRSSLHSELTPGFGQAWTNTGTNEPRQTFDDVKVGFAGTWGVGLDWFPREHWFFGLEFRQILLSRRLHEPTAFGVSQGIEAVRDPQSLTSVLLKIGFKFGASS